jgi:hypothetical protein
MFGLVNPRHSVIRTTNALGTEKGLSRARKNLKILKKALQKCERH